MLYKHYHLLVPFLFFVNILPKETLGNSGLKSNNSKLGTLKGSTTSNDSGGGSCVKAKSKLKEINLESDLLKNVTHEKHIIYKGQVISSQGQVCLQGSNALKNGEWVSYTLSNNESQTNVRTETLSEEQVHYDIAIKGQAAKKEASQVIDEIRQAAVEDINKVQDLLKIHSKVIRESDELNEKLQKVIYEIEQITFEGDGYILPGSGKLKGIESCKDTKKINDILDKFEREVNTWCNDHKAIEQDVLKDHLKISPKFKQQNSYDVKWDRKVKSANKELFLIIEYCNARQFGKAKELLNSYEEHLPKNKEGYLKQSIESKHHSFMRGIYERELSEFCKQNVKIESMQAIPNEKLIEPKELHEGESEEFQAQIQEEMPLVLAHQSTEVILTNNEYKEALFSDVTDFDELVQQAMDLEDENSEVDNKYCRLECEVSNYTLSQNSESLLNAVGIDPIKFTTCYGNKYQQLLHRDHVKILDQSAQVYFSVDKAHQVKELVEHTVSFVDVAREFNQAGFIEKSMTITDFCKGLLECSKGMAEGVLQAVTNTVDLGKKVGQAALHPVETTKQAAALTKQIVEGTTKAGIYFGRLLSYLTTDEELMDIDSDFYEERLRKLDSELEKAHEAIEFVQNFLTETSKNWTVRDYSREVTSFVAEGYLLSRLTKVVSQFTKFGKVKLTKIAKKKTGLFRSTVAIEEIPVASKIVQEGAKELEKVVEQKALERVALATEQISEITQAVKEIIKLEQDLPYLRAKFDGTRKGFAEFATKYIKIPYEHILGPEFSVTRKGIKLSGFHHDYMNAIERSGLFSFVGKTVGKHETYTADILANGRLYKGKTFFPADWDREKVIEKIYEAYADFIHTGAKSYYEESGRLIVEGFTSEGIEIRMYVTKSGKITTAYPKL